MELDFSGLDNLTGISPQEDFSPPLEGEAGQNTRGAEKPATGENRPPEGVTNKRAETRLKQHGEDLRKAREVYAVYGDNIRRAGSLRADILKGMGNGEDPIALLLKAAECIGRLTGDGVFYEQAQKTATAVYGWGLGKPYPLQIKRREAEERLKRLEKAIGRADIPPADKTRLQGAIDAHRKHIDELDRAIKEAGTPEAGHRKGA